MDKPVTAEAHNLMNGKGHHGCRAGRAAISGPKFLADEAAHLIRASIAASGAKLFSISASILKRFRRAMGYE